MSQDSDCDTKISVAKANRKIAKPIMEKKRRARINASLNELKSLLVEVLQKEGCRHSSKMEKADILEMAVRHLKNLQKQQSYTGSPTHTLRDSYPPAIPLEKYAASLPTDCLPPDIGRYLSHTATDSRLKPQSISPDSSTTSKLDGNRNILPAPQPINMSTLVGANNSHIIQPVVTRTANGELAVVLPQHLLKQAGSNHNGLILPIYGLPPSQQPEGKPEQPLSGQQQVMITLNMPLQQSPNSAFSQMSSSSSLSPPSVGSGSPSPSTGHPSAPASPVWRPW